MSSVEAEQQKSIPDTNSKKSYLVTDEKEVVDIFDNLGKPIGNLKNFVCGLILVPIKVVILLPLLLTYTVYVMIIACFAPRRGEPLTYMTNKIFRFISRLVARFISLFAGYIYVPVKGKAQRNARIIVANHTSEIELLYLYWLFAPSYVAAEFVYQKPLVRAWATANMMVGVDRKKGGNYEKFKEVLQERVDDKRFPPTVLFPEGTTSNGTHLTHFHSGAFSIGQPVHPVVIHNHFYFTDPSWSIVHFMKVLYRQFSQIISGLSVKSLPIYHPSQAEIDHPQYYAWNVKHVMARAGNFAISELTLREKNAWEKLRKHLPKDKIPIAEDIRSRIPKINGKKGFEDLDKHTEIINPLLNNPEIISAVEDEDFDEYTFYIPPEAYDCDKNDFYSNAVLPPPEILEYIESLGKSYKKYKTSEEEKEVNDNNNNNNIEMNTSNGSVSSHCSTSSFDSSLSSFSSSQSPTPSFSSSSSSSSSTETPSPYESSVENKHPQTLQELVTPNYRCAAKRPPPSMRGWSPYPRNL